MKNALFLLPLFLIIIALAFSTLHMLPNAITGTSYNMMLMTFLVLIPFVIGIVYMIRK
jgi:hypothetical protein